MRRNNYKGRFIVFEGLDGCGKSAQAKLLVEFLRQQGKEVVATKEQTVGSEAGRKIKRILMGEEGATPLELQGLFVQDRKEHTENLIEPSLKAGKFVICERYSFSTMAFGCSAGLDIDLLAKMNDNFVLPDLTIIIDVSAESCMKRIEARGEQKEFFEKTEKLAKVRECYKKIPKMFKNIFFVNGEGLPEKVFEEIKGLIKRCCL